MNKLKVLIAIDDPNLAKTIVRSACRIINKNFSEITLLNVLETSVAEETYFYISPQKFIEHESEKSDFAYIENYLETNGFDYKGFVYKEGNAADNIIKMAENEKFDLIVIGSHNKGTVQRLLLGSVSYKVSRYCKTSVLVIKPSFIDESQIEKNYSVLFTVDSSDYSEYASNNIGKFLDKKRAYISILNVMPPIQEIIPTDAYMYTDMSRIMEESELVSKEITRNAAINVAKQGLNIEKKYQITGTAAHTIINEAKQNNSDLIVMGSHGKSAIEDWFLGGVSSRVSEYSTIPVLIIKKNL